MMPFISPAIASVGNSLFRASMPDRLQRRPSGGPFGGAIAGAYNRMQDRRRTVTPEQYQQARARMMGKGYEPQRRMNLAQQIGPWGSVIGGAVARSAGDMMERRAQSRPQAYPGYPDWVRQGLMRSRGYQQPDQRRNQFTRRGEGYLNRLRADRGGYESRRLNPPPRPRTAADAMADERRQRIESTRSPMSSWVD